MYRATVQKRHSHIDQENLELKIKEWEKESPDDNFFFRPYTHVSNSRDDGAGDDDEDDENESCDDDIVEIKQEQHSNNLLVVHQAQWQRQILEKYGSDICLLDATYKTSRYALPVFFMCVKTNVDYCVVASLSPNKRMLILFGKLCASCKVGTQPGILISSWSISVKQK